MTVLLAVVAGTLGLAIGSFLNVVVARVPAGESVLRPRSRCPRCSAEIRPRDNVPVVSWLLLRGHCRTCAAPISARYPLIELLTGIVFGFVVWRLGARLETLAFLYLAAVGIALAAIDLLTRRLPNVLTLPSYVVGGLLLTCAALVEHRPGRLGIAVVGMATMYALYFVLAMLGGMGFGDVKLAGVLGLFLGFLGWGTLILGAFLSFLLGGIGGLALIMARRAGRKSRVPFGPYMVAGALLAVLVGSQVTQFYTSHMLT